MNCLIRQFQAYRLVCIALFFLISACASRLDRAPVLDHSTLNGTVVQRLADAGVQAPPGYYRVQPGDTLYRIAVEHGQHYRDLATWNNLETPTQIEVGQLLRMTPPADSTTMQGEEPGTGGVIGALASPVRETGVQAVRPLGTTTPSAVPAAKEDTHAAARTSMSQEVAFVWPVRGNILSGFDENRNKGMDIAGTAGAPVRAAASGRVVYAGSGLRGYGNLVIIKHNPRFLSAYAHNRILLVKEGMVVKSGQKIAEMGDSDAGRVKLHFEIRKQGKPVDPVKYLPAQ